LKEVMKLISSSEERFDWNWNGIHDFEYC